MLIMQNKREYWLVLFLLLCSVWVMMSCGDERSYTIVAYVPDWKDNWGADDELAKEITHINYAFANIVDGRVVEGGIKDNIDLSKIRELKRVNPKLKILISIGGWTWSGNFSDVAMTAGGRKLFASSAIDYMIRHQLDGIDIDWEYPGLPGAGNIHRAADKEHFTALLREVRTQLDSVEKLQDRKYILTIATAASQAYLDHTEMEKVSQIVDFINIMTYDFHGGWEGITGHHANLRRSLSDKDTATVSAAIAVSQHQTAGVPHDKLVLGVPFYGRYWQGVTPANHGLYQSANGVGGSVNYTAIRDSLLASGFEYHWDSTAVAPYLWHPGDSTFVTYENPKSLKAKIQFVKENHLKGIMFWQFNGDDGELVRVIGEGLRKP